MSLIGKVVASYSEEDGDTTSEHDGSRKKLEETQLPGNIQNTMARRVVRNQRSGSGPF